MHRPPAAALRAPWSGVCDEAGGAFFAEEHVLLDGTPIVLRSLRPTDGAIVEAVFACLSPRSRYARFLGLVKALSPQMLRSLTDVDDHDRIAIVAFSRDGAAEKPLGIARFTRSAEDPELAEAAVAIIDEAQQKGLGRILSVALARAAVARGIRRFHGPVLRDNRAVRSLLDEVGATFRTTEDGLEFEVSLVDGGPHPVRERLERVARNVLRAVTSLEHAGTEGARESDPLPGVEPR